MIVNAQKLYSYLYSIILLLQLYIPSVRVNIYLQIVLLGAFFFVEKPMISVRFYKVLVPIVVVILMGFIGTMFHRYNLYNVIKDIIHFIRPLISILIGYLFFRRINDFNLFVKTVIITGFLSSIIHYYVIFFVNNGLETLSDLREFSKDNVLELFALFFFAYYKKFQNEKLFASKILSRILYASILFSCIIYFSRTMIIMGIIILMTVQGYTMITKKGLKIMSLVIVLIIGLYAFLFSINIQRKQSGFESFLYKLKVAPEEIFKTKIDRENHADLWDHWRGYEAKRAFALLDANPSGYFIGCGYGSLVNLKFFAPLSRDLKGMKYISELHNGYIFLLYKVGIFGLIFYIILLIGLYRNIYVAQSFEKVFISSIALCLMFATLVIGSIFNGNPTMLLLVGALLYYDDVRKKAVASSKPNNQISE